MSNSDKIYVAKLGKTVGLKGAIKIYIDSDFPEQFKTDAAFTTQKNKQLVVENYNPHNNTVKASIRQNLQVLRDKKILLFIERGVYILSTN